MKNIRNFKQHINETAEFNKMNDEIEVMKQLFLFSFNKWICQNKPKWWVSKKFDSLSIKSLIPEIIDFIDEGHLLSKWEKYHFKLQIKQHETNYLLSPAKSFTQIVPAINAVKKIALFSALWLAQNGDSLTQKIDSNRLFSVGIPDPGRHFGVDSVLDDKVMYNNFAPESEYHFNESLLQETFEKFEKNFTEETKDFISETLKLFKESGEKEPFLRNNIPIQSEDFLKIYYRSIDSYLDEAYKVNPDFFRQVLEIPGYDVFLSRFAEKNFTGQFLDDCLNMIPSIFQLVLSSDRSLISKVNFEPKHIKMIKDNLPEFFQQIKSLRLNDQRWKTDLEADLGDLGF